MRILFLGDIVGRPGRSVLENNLRRIQDEEKIDFTIANGENSSGGFGMNKKGYDAMIMSGIDVFTMEIIHLIINGLLISLMMPILYALLI